MSQLPLAKNFRQNTFTCLFTLASLFLFSSCSIFQARPDGSPSHERSARADQSETHNGRFGYRGPRLFPPKNETQPSVLAPNEEIAEAAELPEIFADDMDRGTLEKVILNQLTAMTWVDSDAEVQLGELTTTQGKLRETLLSFLRLIRQNLSPQEFSQQVRENYVFYKAGKGASKRILFTGYYAPIIDASTVPTEEYRFPLYGKPLDPPDLAFSTTTPAQTVGYPSTHARTWKDYTREEIDGQGILKDKNLEIAWLKDDLERFFLHIQGSGLLQFTDGTTKVVRYKDSNGHTYRGVGKVMVEDGAIPLEQGSMQGIKRYFREHPEDIEKYLFQNKRYIFFMLSDQGPKGSGGAELVGGRSIATDKSIYPPGALGFLQLKKPVLNDQEKIERWDSFSRFVLDQDTGSAIRGPGRGDLYFGEGHIPGVMAGQFHVRGSLYYLLKKS